MTTIVSRGDVRKGMPILAEDPGSDFPRGQVSDHLRAGPPRPELEY